MPIYMNDDKIKEMEKELIQYKGFIPLQFDGYINMKKRNDYLKKNGLFDYVQREKISVRQKMKTSADADAYLDMFLKNWINQNPKFKECIIIE